jgi:hypothetical protein
MAGDFLQAFGGVPGRLERGLEIFIPELKLG